MEKYLGMEDSQLDISTAFFRISGKVGNKLKEAGTSHWTSPNSPTNSSGFTALPGNGRGSDGQIYLPGGFALFWTGTGSEGRTWQRALAGSETGILRYFETNDWAMSVRCVKNQ